MGYPSNRPGKVDGNPMTATANSAAPKKIAKGRGTITSGQPHIAKHAPNRMGHNPGYKAPRA